MNIDDSFVSVEMDDIIPLILESLKQNKPIQIKCRGKSMYPFLHDLRDGVTLVPIDGHKIRRGDILLYSRMNGVYGIHRVYSIDKSGSVCFVGDAQYRLEPGICPEQLVAYIPTVLRNGKKISCESGIWRSVMTSYMLMRVKCPKLARRLYIFCDRCSRLFKNPKMLSEGIKRRLHKENSK